MGTAPRLPGTPSGESPADRALALTLAKEIDSALRWSVALVKSESAAPLGIYITARLLAMQGRREVGIEGLEVAIGRAIDAGNLPLAVAAACELGEIGGDPEPHFDAIAKAFSKNSPRLLHQGATPPELPRSAQEFQPLPAALAGKALLAKAQEIMHEARQLYDQEKATRTSEPKVVQPPLFGSLDLEQLCKMLRIFEVITVPSGAVVIEEGTAGAEAYILARGEVEVRRRVHEEKPETIVLARLGSGTLFGEMALLSRAPRAASVVACRPSIILVARKDALEEIAATEPEVANVFADHCRRRMVENLVRTSSILSAVKPDERPALVERFVTRTYEDGDRVIEQGTESEGLHLIASGEVVVMIHEGEDTTMLAKLGVGEVVGEVALVLRRPATADVIAACPTVTLHLPRERFLELIKEHPAILAELYDLAVKRDEETTSVVAQEATDADDFVLV